MAISNSLKQRESVSETTTISEIFDRVRELEDAGEYNEAALELGSWWQGAGIRPAKVDSLSENERAQILSRIGSLSGWYGSREQTKEVQDGAKDLLSEAIGLFEKTGDKANAIETRSDLAVCYWREGAYNEARDFLKETLGTRAKISSALRGKILLRMVNVEISTYHYADALRLVDEATSLVEKFGDSLLLGKLYFHRALIMRKMAEEGNNPKLLDSAVADYRLAAEFYQQAGHLQFLANVENNTGFLFFTMKKYEESQRHYDAALEILTHQKDMGIAGPVYDNKAQTFLAQGKLEEAEKAARTSVIMLRDGDENASLAESLTTLGTILSRRKNFAQAALSFTEAKESALLVRDAERAGSALLTQLEELQEFLEPAEYDKVYSEAAGLLENSPRLQTVDRLNRAAMNISVVSTNFNWENFSLPDAVMAYEGEIILKAITESNGRVTKAATLLGLSHQNLSLILHQRHRELKKHCVQRKPRTVNKAKTH
jgi:tetratricopeptide (TPR) repeat protein